MIELIRARHAAQLFLAAFLLIGCPSGGNEDTDLTLPIDASADDQSASDSSSDGVTDTGTDLGGDTSEDTDAGNGDTLDDGAGVDVELDSAGSDGVSKDEGGDDTGGDAGDVDGAADTGIDDVGDEPDGDDDVSGDVVEPLQGDGKSCLSAYEIVGTPFEHWGTTVDGGADYFYGPGDCPGETGGWGLKSSDLAYVFTPVQSATYIITLNASFDSTIYVVESCLNVGSTCLGADDELGANVTEQVIVSLESEKSYYIIVDGYGNTVDQKGAYQLTLSDPCTPLCQDGSCDDGCGGTCPCAEGTTCNALNGLCEGKVGGDTCGQAAVIVELPYQALGDTNNPEMPYSDTYSVASFVCSGLDFGAGFGSKDAAFRFTPDETSKYEFTIQPEASFDAALYVVGDCTALSATCVGGVDVGGPGETESTTLLLEVGVTYFAIIDGAGASDGGAFAIGLDYSCQPVCGEGLCGDNGCGGQCACPDGDSCVEGACCTPICDGLGCGDDSCGGTCACAPGTTCNEGTLLCASAAEGDQCANAFVIDPATLPTVQPGNTGGFVNDYAFADNACPGEAIGYGGGSPDVVHSFTAAKTGVYHIGLTPAFDAVLYVLENCDDPNQSCLAASEVVEAEGEPAEEVYLNLDAGQTVFIVVDGYSNSNWVSGAYELSVGAPCQPTCDPGLCGGADGCGSVCGCAEGMVCHPQTQACALSQGGNNCAEATVAVPLSVAAGDTQWADDNYGVDPGVCPGLDGDGGYGSPDHTYVLKPEATGVYPISLDSDFDGVLYVVKNCADVAGTCLAGADDVGGGQTETIFLTASADQNYFIIVDGYGVGSDGVYLLNVGPPCIPQCAPGTCTADGCGGTCLCSVDQECKAGLCE